MFMPISSEDWVCACGGRRKIFFNPERSRALRCPSCDLVDILTWLRLPAESIIRELDQEFLSACRILDDAKLSILDEYDRQFLRDCGIRPESV